MPRGGREIFLGHQEDPIHASASCQVESTARSRMRTDGAFKARQRSKAGPDNRRTATENRLGVGVGCLQRQERRTRSVRTIMHTPIMSRSTQELQEKTHSLSTKM
jgi:hypothetical protein